MNQYQPCACYKLKLVCACCSPCGQGQGGSAREGAEANEKPAVLPQVERGPPALPAHAQAPKGRQQEKVPKEALSVVSFRAQLTAKQSSQASIECRVI